jgi:hypothetical protein
MGSAALTPETLLPLLIADGDVDFIPAQLWVLDAALVVLARETPETSAIGRALARMPQVVRPAGQQFTGLRTSIHRLVATGMLRPKGSGWDAGYVAAPEMRDSGLKLRSALAESERVGLRRAAQVLNEASRMLSKNEAAAAPSGSGTI